MTTSNPNQPTSVSALMVASADFHPFSKEGMQSFQDSVTAWLASVATRMGFDGDDNNWALYTWEKGEYVEYLRSGPETKMNNRVKVEETVSYLPPNSPGQLFAPGVYVKQARYVQGELSAHERETHRAMTECIGTGLPIGDSQRTDITVEVAADEPNTWVRQIVTIDSTEFIVPMRKGVPEAVAPESFAELLTLDVDGMVTADSPLSYRLSVTERGRVAEQYQRALGRIAEFCSESPED